MFQCAYYSFSLFNPCKKVYTEKQHLSPQVRILSNSFLFDNDITETQQNQHALNSESSQKRHLISGRDFEDILEACRPRNCGDSSKTGIPSALLHRLEFNYKDYKSEKSDENDPYSISKKNSEEEKLQIPEWGSVVYEEINSPVVASKQIPTISEYDHTAKSPVHLFLDDLAINSSNSGSSNYQVPSPSSNGLQIQVMKDIHLSMPTFENDGGQLKTISSTDSLSTVGTPEIGLTQGFGKKKKSVSIEALYKSMMNYDNAVFSPVPERVGVMNFDKTILCGRDSQLTSL